MADAKRDGNYVTTALGVSSVDSVTTLPFNIDPLTGRLLADVTTGVSSLTAGTGILLTPNPIVSTGTVALSTALQPIASLTGNSLKVLRVNAGETAVEYATISSGLTVGTTTIASGTTTRILYDNAGVLGEYSVIPVALGGTNVTSASITAFNNITGYTASGATGTTSTNIVFSTSPTLITPVLGVASATSINKITLTTPASGSTLTIIDGKTLTINKTISFTAADDTGVYTLPTGTKTLVATDVATLSSLTAHGTITSGGLGTGAVIGGVTMTLGSDANYDTYYRNSSGVLTRLANGTTGQVLTATTNNAPSWGSAGGSYAQLSSDTLGSDSATFTTSTFTAKKNLKVIIYLPATSSDQLKMQFNGDTGNNYSGISGLNYISQGTYSGGGRFSLEQSSESASRYLTIEILNISAVTKRIIYQEQVTTDNYQGAGIWNNTAAQITSITLFLSGGSNLIAGSTIQVFGMD